MNKMRTLEITTYIGCPVKCDYCPQDKLLLSYRGGKIMTLNNFKKFLWKVPKDVRIDFSGFSEPFYNPETISMMQFAYNSNYHLVLYTTLDVLTKEDIRKLKNIRFDEVVFHKYPNSSEKWDEIREEFEREVQSGRIAEITEQWKWSRASNLWTIPYKPGPGHCLFAGKLFNHNVLLPNGDVVICCQDYSLKHIIGNLHEKTYNDLNRMYLRLLSDEEDSELLCRNCELFQSDSRSGCCI